LNLAIVPLLEKSTADTFSASGRSFSPSIHACRSSLER
jgi:hypothetical protein